MHSNIPMLIKSKTVKLCDLRFLCLFVAGFALYSCGTANSEIKPSDSLIKVAIDTPDSGVNSTSASPAIASFDTALYNQKIQYMLNGDSSGKWPAKAPYPLAGAILPFKRVVAFYGNLYSTRMGILGELPKPQMFAKLKEEVAKWEKADPQTPVQPALHYIAVTAQGSPGAAGKYRLRMPFTQIDKVIAMADEINAIVFLDIQVGLGTVQQEVPELVEYLKKPNVHLGIDPEFSMKTGQKPGSVIGSFDENDINYTINFLSKIVKENNLPPKILTVHRFTQGMIKNAKLIKPTPEVQVVMHMDGWGEPAKKIGTYKYFIYAEPVQFTGFKLFYKNDLKIATQSHAYPGRPHETKACAGLYTVSVGGPLSWSNVEINVITYNGSCFGGTFFMESGRCLH